MKEALRQQFQQATDADCDVAARLLERANLLDVSLPAVRMIADEALRAQVCDALDKITNHLIDTLVNNGHGRPEET